MKNFLLSAKPNFGEVKCTLKDERGNETLYVLQNVPNNGCHFDVYDCASGLERDRVNFSKQDLRALWCLLTVKE